MTTFVFANNVSTTLATAISPSTTSITLASSAHLPASIPAGDYFVLTLSDAATRSNFEVVYATAVSGATLTVLRGQEGTAALSWLVGDYAFSPVTAGQMASFGAGGVTSFNTRLGAVTLSSADVTGALGYTPYSNAGGTVSGNVAATGTIQATSTFYSGGTTAILATGPATTGVSGTVYLRPHGYSDSTAQVTVNATGTLQANPTAPVPSSGVPSFGFVSDGAYGGGMGMISGTANWGWWVDASNNLIFGYGTSGGALTPVFGISSAGNVIAQGTIQGGTTP